MASKGQTTGMRGVYLIAAELGVLLAALCAQFYSYDLQSYFASFRRLFFELAVTVGDVAPIGLAKFSSLTALSLVRHKRSDRCSGKRLLSPWL